MCVSNVSGLQRDNKKVKKHFAETKREKQNLNKKYS